MCKTEDLIVMVVESDEAELKSICSSLAHLGISHIICVYTYQEAVEMVSLEEDNIDIVIADYEIEEGKELGTLLVSFIKEKYPSTLVILRSKEYSFSVVLNCVKTNANDIIDKRRDNDIEHLLPKWIAVAKSKNETMELLHGFKKRSSRT